MVDVDEFQATVKELLSAEVESAALIVAKEELLEATAVAVVFNATDDEVWGAVEVTSSALIEELLTDPDGLSDAVEVFPFMEEP